MIDCQRTSRMKPSQKPVFHPTIGREGETATLLSTALFTLKLRVGGFAPRHLSRSLFRGFLKQSDI